MEDLPMQDLNESPPDPPSASQPSSAARKSLCPFTADHCRHQRTAEHRRRPTDPELSCTPVADPHSPPFPPPCLPFILFLHHIITSSAPTTPFQPDLVEGEGTEGGEEPADPELAVDPLSWPASSLWSPSVDDTRWWRVGAERRRKGARWRRRVGEERSSGGGRSAVAATEGRGSEEEGRTVKVVGLDLNLKMRGQILINGRSQKLAFGTSAYVTQDNVLMVTLTVREAIYYSAQIQLPDTMSTAEKLARADDTVREMGLTGALDIRIGGRSSKGISGGQQKRLSICLDILTCPRLLFLDEPTSGLDSAASFHVMSRITSLAAREGMTIVAVVHQPCSEVFELFHGLCLLASGSTIFFGPASTAAEFFASNGYPCPPMRNPSDHFLRTVNKDFDKESKEGLPCMPAEEAIDILVNSYKSSNTSEVANQEMRYDRAIIGRNRPGFITKTLARSHMLMFIATLLTFMAIGGFPSFVEDMKIFRRERLNGHYGVAAFVISNTLSSIPYLLLNAVVLGAIAYYLTGLQGKIEHFVYFALVLCACTMLVEALMMIVATIVPDFLMGIITGAGIQGIMMLTSGFFQIPNNLPKILWKYPMYYISFHKYALQGFYKNEFSGLVFQSNLGGQETVSGEKVIVELFQVETGHSRWVDLAVIDVVKPMLLGLTFRCNTKCICGIENLCSTS
uniref:ABC transporter domain-containing protein n=1 Tax=Oryza barthii TaxID=65489 RepID=A0A0D3HBH1_9ORYZ